MRWENVNRHPPNNHKHVTKYTHAAHALIGCHSVSYYLVGTGKATDLKLYMGGHHLTELVQQGADEDNLIFEATTFVAACCGSIV